MKNESLATDRSVFLVIDGPSLEGMRYHFEKRLKLQQRCNLDYACNLSITLLKCVRVQEDSDEFMPVWDKPIDLPIIPVGTEGLLKLCEDSGAINQQKVRMQVIVTQDVLAFDTVLQSWDEFDEGRRYEVYYDVVFRVGCFGIADYELNWVGYAEMKRLIDNRKLRVLNAGTLPLDLFEPLREANSYKHYFKVVDEPKEECFQKLGVVELKVTKMLFDVKGSVEMFAEPVKLVLEILDLEVCGNFLLVQGSIAKDAGEVKMAVGFNSNSARAEALKTLKRVSLCYRPDLGSGVLAVYERSILEIQEDEMRRLALAHY